MLSATAMRHEARRKSRYVARCTHSAQRTAKDAKAQV